MNIAVFALILLIVAAPMLISMALVRVSQVLYSGPATVLALAAMPDRQGMYMMMLSVAGVAPIKFTVSASRAKRVFNGENAVMVSVARRFIDGKTVIDQILWQYETKQAAHSGRYDKIKPDHPVDQDLGIIPGLLYFGLSLGSVALFIGNNFVSSLMAADPILMHAFWYGHAACVTLCGYWLARKQPHIAGYLSEGGSGILLGVLFSLIGSFAALATIMFYQEPSPLMLLGAICASSVGMLIAMILGAFTSHPSAAEPIFEPGRLDILEGVLKNRALLEPAKQRQIV